MKSSKMVLQLARHMATNNKPLVDMCKVGIIGSNGGIGRHLALMLKLNNYVTDLSLYSGRDARGVAVDLSHIDTPARVTAYSGEQKNLIEAMKCCDMVIITAGLAHSEKVKTRTELFNANAALMLKFTKAIACACPQKMPFIHIVTNPVNSLVPICAEYLKYLSCYDPRKVSGSSSIDSTRARTFLSQLKHVDPKKYNVPVIGGHSANTITPLVSQTKPAIEMTSEEQNNLAYRIIHGVDEVLNAKKGTGTAQLALGYCVGRFCNSYLSAIYGEKDVIEVGFVPADVNDCEFFACYFTLDKNGVKECQRLPPMTESEIHRYCEAVEHVKKNSSLAKKFVLDYVRGQKEKA